MNNNNNNNNNSNRVPGAAGGRERAVPAISVDTLRSGIFCFFGWLDGPEPCPLTRKAKTRYCSGAGEKETLNINVVGKKETNRKKANERPELTTFLK